MAGLHSICLFSRLECGWELYSCAPSRCQFQLCQSCWFGSGLMFTFWLPGSFQPRMLWDPCVNSSSLQAWLPCSGQRCSGAATEPFINAGSHYATSQISVIQPRHLEGIQ